MSITINHQTNDISATSGGLSISKLVLNSGYTEQVFALSGTTPALSPANGTIQTWALSANSAPTAGTWDSGQSLTLLISNPSGYTVTWPSITWRTDVASAPTLRITGYTIVQLWKVNTVIYGARVGEA